MNELMSLQPSGEFNRTFIIFPDGAGVDDMVIHVIGGTKSKRKALAYRLCQQFNAARIVKEAANG